MSCGPSGRDDNCMLHLISDEFLSTLPRRLNGGNKYGIV